MENYESRDLLESLRADIGSLKAAPLFPNPATVRAAVEKTFKLLEYLLERAESQNG